MIPEILIQPPDALATEFAARIDAIVRRTGRCALALPGGSVAETFLPVLAHADLDWSRVQLFWCDERAVPPEHPDSNYRIAAERLFDRIDIDPRQVHRMKGEAPNLEQAAADYENDMRTALGDSRLDLALLGVGPDGHVCSLFPDHPALDERMRWVVPIVDSPKPPARRLTLTLQALEGIEIVIAAFGTSKAAVIRDAIENPASRLPVALAARAASHAVWMLEHGV